MELNEALCVEAHEEVQARLAELTPLKAAAEERAKAALFDGNRAVINQAGRQLVLLEREADLLDIVGFSLGRLRRHAALLAAPTVPPKAAQDLGVVAFAADVCTLPAVGALRAAVFAHYGLDPATCAPARLPRGGAGPGEAALLRGMTVPKTLVELFDPRFQQPLQSVVTKRLCRLTDVLLAQKAAASASASSASATTPSTTTTTPFPAPAHSPFPAPQASPFPAVPTTPSDSPFPTVPHTAAPPHRAAPPHTAAPHPHTAAPPHRAAPHPQPQPAIRRSAQPAQIVPQPPAPMVAEPPSPVEAPVARRNSSEQRRTSSEQRRNSSEQRRTSSEQRRSSTTTVQPQAQPQSPSGKQPGLFGFFMKLRSHKDGKRGDRPPSPVQGSSSSSSPPSPQRGPSPVAAGAAAEVQQPPSPAEPAAPTPESGDVVELKSSDVEVAPARLSFGLSSRQAPVDQALTEELQVTNPHRSVVYVLLEHVADARTDAKYSVAFSPPVSFAVAPGATERVTATLRVLCTTKLEVQFSLKTWKERARRYKDARLLFATESQLTTRLDPDELKRDEVIGDGAYGVVYSGRYRGMDVAIKVLKYQEYVTDEMRAEFAAEVDMMEKLRHSAILNFVGAVHIPGQLQIVTELCPYGSFLSAMKKYPADFTEALRVKVLLDAANGMDFLHQSGIIHRDLKPDNLLIVSLEPRASVAAKLSDFGTTRDVNCFAAQMQSTKGVGTPLFMAPEIFMNKPYDKSVDVYSYSLIVYVAFAGELPFEGDPVANTPWAYADAIKSGKRPPVPDSCPAPIAQLMRQCWSPEPSQRPSFEDIHMILRKFFKENYHF